MKLYDTGKKKIEELLIPFFLLGKIIWKSSPVISVLYLLIKGLESLTPILQLLAVKYIIDAIIYYPDTHQLSQAYVWIGLYALSLFIQTISSSLGEWFNQVLAEKSRLKINQELLKAMDRNTGLEYYENSKYRDTLETLRDSTGWLPLNLINFTTVTISQVVSLVGVIAIIASISPLIAIAIVISSLPFTIKYNNFKQLEWDEQYELAPYRRKVSYYRRLLMSPKAAKELKLFNNGNYFIKKYNETFDLLYRRMLTLQKKGVKGIVTTGLISGGTAGLGYLWIVFHVGRGTLSPGDIALFLTSIFVLSDYLRESIISGALTIDVWRMGNDFVKFITIEENQDCSIKKENIFGNQGVKIQFDDVTFGYPFNKEVSVIKNLSFTINKGEKVAIVGDNGSGKTSIVKLICNFYTPEQGQIKVNGKNIKNFNVKSYRSKIAVVFQQYGKYAFTVADNIEMGNTEGKENSVKITRASKLAGIHEYIKTLPKGYNMLLGRDWGGTELSGGQWQKIAIARGFFREAELIILDEPTAALDVRSEYEMYKNFNELTKDKTTILISHRFSTVRMADKIIVLKNGSIIEQGNHQQLMELNGEYAEMYNKQSIGFKKKVDSYEKEN